MSLDVKLLTGKKIADMPGRTQQAQEVAHRFADFVAAATETLDIAIYHFKLAGPEGQIVADALNGAAEKGVKVRIAYFHEKQRGQSAEHLALTGGDSDEPSDFSGVGNGVQLQMIQGIDLNHLPVGTMPEPIEGGGHLMHSKYMVRDASAVWMGSANFTSEAWSVQDNNIVTIESPELARYYGSDFDDLWRTGRIAGTGKDDRGTVTVDSIKVDVDFSPGDGRTIDYQIAGAISAATHSVTIASMVISSGAVLNALVEAVERGVNVTGTYDGPQMAGVAKHWSGVSDAAHGGATNGKAEQWQIVQSHLTGKKSMPFNPNKPGIPYNFMHNKVVVIDRQVVVTGSFNFSENATRNAENVITIHDPAIAETYDRYIADLVTLFGG